MLQDPIVNVVYRLGECGFDPRRVGDNAWEARCPAHRCSERALSITRKDFNSVVLECRSNENCRHDSIIRALGFTDKEVYAVTPFWLVDQVRSAEIERASFDAARIEACPLAVANGQLQPALLPFDGAPMFGCPNGAERDSSGQRPGDIRGGPEISVFPKWVRERPG
jgi:hypothetical protein